MINGVCLNNLDSRDQQSIVCFKTRYSIESVDYPGTWELLQIVRKDFKIAKEENVWTDNCFRTIAVARCKFQKINVCLFS